MSSRSAPQIEHRYTDPNTYHGDLPPDWDGRRKATYRRDDWTCQHCGTQSGPHASGGGVRLHAHHTQPRSEGGSNHLSNLVTLCEPGHQKVHDHDIFGDGWEGDSEQPRTPIFGATRGGWATAALVSLSGLYFTHWFGGFVGLFDGLTGGSFLGMLAGIYLVILVVTVRKPVSVMCGYGLLGVVVLFVVTMSGQPALDTNVLLGLTWGVAVFLAIELSFDQLEG